MPSTEAPKLLAEHSTNGGRKGACVESLLYKMIQDKRNVRSRAELAKVKLQKVIIQAWL